MATPVINPSSPMNSGLIAWYLAHPEYTGTSWPDLTGNGHNGTFVNSSTIWDSSDYPNSTGASVHINSTSGTGVNIGPITISSIRTLLAWVKPMHFGQQHILGAYSPSSPFAGLGVSLGIPSDSQRIGWWNGTWAQSSSSVTNSVWSLVGYTYNTTTSLLTFYRNGATLTGGGTKSAPGNYTGNLIIGARADLQSALGGKISDFRLYDRALTTQEVLDYYNESVAGYPNVLLGESSPPKITLLSTGSRPQLIL